MLWTQATARATVHRQHGRLSPPWKIYLSSSYQKGPCWRRVDPAWILECHLGLRGPPCRTPVSIHHVSRHLLATNASSSPEVDPTCEKMDTTGAVCASSRCIGSPCTSTQAFRSLWLEVLCYGGGGGVPARTSPPEGGLRSWPNERPGD